jgi:hypothetical protein
MITECSLMCTLQNVFFYVNLRGTLLPLVVNGKEEERVEPLNVQIGTEPSLNVP